MNIKAECTDLITNQTVLKFIVPKIDAHQICYQVMSESFYTQQSLTYLYIFSGF